MGKHIFIFIHVNKSVEQNRSGNKTKIGIH